MLDDEGNLSLSNIAVIIALVKMSFSHTAPVDAGALFATLLNYAHKRYIISKGDPVAQSGPTSIESGDSSS